MQDTPGRRFPSSISVRLDQPLIDGEALNHVLLDDDIRPSPELNTELGVYAETNGNDRLKIILPSEARDHPSALFPNYREILGSCRLLKFSVGVDVFQVKPDIVGAASEEISHLPLRQPNRIVLNTSGTVHLNTKRACWRLATYCNMSP